MSLVLEVCPRFVIMKSGLELMESFGEISDLLSKHHVVCFKLDLILDPTDSTVQSIAPVLQSSPLLFQSRNDLTIMALKRITLEINIIMRIFYLILKIIQFQLYMIF